MVTDRQTDRQTDKHTHGKTTLTLRLRTRVNEVIQTSKVAIPKSQLGYWLERFLRSKLGRRMVLNIIDDNMPPSG